MRASPCLGRATARAVCPAPSTHCLNRRQSLDFLVANRHKQDSPTEHAVQWLSLQCYNAYCVPLACIWLACNQVGLIQVPICAEEPTSKLAAKNASLKEILILGLPMCFDLTATLLMSIGLL